MRHQRRQFRVGVNVDYVVDVMHSVFRIVKLNNGCVSQDGVVR